MQLIPNEPQFQVLLPSTGGMCTIFFFVSSLIYEDLNSEPLI